MTNINENQTRVESVYFISVYLISSLSLYFNLPEGNAICHLMGEPQEERLVWLHNEQAITSPEWSIHAAAGTSNYTFIWGMAGENLKYSDKDEIKYTEMK